MLCWLDSIWRNSIVRYFFLRLIYWVLTTCDNLASEARPSSFGVDIMLSERKISPFFIPKQIWILIMVMKTSAVLILYDDSHINFYLSQLMVVCLAGDHLESVLEAVAVEWRQETDHVLNQDRSMVERNVQDLHGTKWNVTPTHVVSVEIYFYWILGPNFAQD